MWRVGHGVPGVVVLSFSLAKYDRLGMMFLKRLVVYDATKQKERCRVLDLSKVKRAGKTATLNNIAHRCNAYSSFLTRLNYINYIKNLKTATSFWLWHLKQAKSSTLQKKAWILQAIEWKTRQDSKTSRLKARALAFHAEVRSKRNLTQVSIPVKWCGPLYLSFHRNQGCRAPAIGKEQTTFSKQASVFFSFGKESMGKLPSL